MLIEKYDHAIKEVMDRAGGLALLRRLRYTFEVISTARAIERKGIADNREGLAGYALRASKAAPGDVLIIGSVSGKTVPVVDMALEAHKLGLTVIAVTSMAYSSSVSSAHSCGKHLYEMTERYDRLGI